MKLLARAKINWTLDILGQRPDGYHELRMLMQPVTLADEITLTPAETLTLAVEGGDGIPCDQTNIAWRAAEALARETGVTASVAIRIRKRIPSQAGLGGGSADAAAVLIGLNRLWETGLSGERLERIGLTLGADVPFCLRGGLCIAEGVGERLTQQPTAPCWPLLIVKPCEGLSTAEVYRDWHRTLTKHVIREAALLRAVNSDRPVDLPSHPGNALEAVSMAARSAIAQAVQALRDQGAVCAQMSGSGSAVFGVFPDQAARDAALAHMATDWPFVCACETAADSVLMGD